MIVLLDLDGVVADWNRAVAELLNLDFDKMIANWTPGVYEITEELGVHVGWLWQKVDAHETFWEDIKPFDNAKDLMKLLKPYEVHVCTSPSQSPSCAAGKVKWIKKHTKYGRNFAITPQKHLLAGPNKVLIDDTDKKINKFRAFGGHGILYPQPWNTNRDIFYAGKQLDYLKEELDKLDGN